MLYQKDKERKEDKNMENNLVLFENQSLDLMKQLSDLKTQKEKLEELDKEIRSQLLEAMNKYDIISFKNDYVSISNVAPTESVSIDLKKLEEKESELYNELLADYPKVTKRAGYVRITVK